MLMYIQCAYWHWPNTDVKSFKLLAGSARLSCKPHHKGLLLRLDFRGLTIQELNCPEKRLL